MDAGRRRRLRRCFVFRTGNVKILADGRRRMRIVRYASRRQYLEAHVESFGNEGSSSDSRKIGDFISFSSDSF